MEAITKGPAFGERKILHACPIVKNPRALNSRTKGVTMIKRELNVYFNTEKPHKKFQVPM
jgi:hypothetical protein